MLKSLIHYPTRLYSSLPSNKKELNKALYMIEHSLINEDGVTQARPGINIRSISSSEPMKPRIYGLSKSISTYSDQVVRLQVYSRPGAFEVESVEGLRC